MKILEPSKLNLTSTILDHKVKSIYVASPHKGAGTTTCAYSLAKALSESISEKVILIDGNPIDDISILDRASETVVLVMKSGRVVKNRL